MDKGCEYGRVNRVMIKEIKSDVTQIKEGINDLRDEMRELYNHQSSRLPLWATLLFTLLSSLSVGLIIFALKL